MNTRRAPGRKPDQIELWFLTYLLLGIAVYGLSVILMPLIVAAAGHRPFRIGAVVALQNTGLLAAPGAGLWMDKFGRHRLVLMLGCLMIALGFLGFSSVTSLNALLFSAFCIGLGTAAATTATMVFTIEKRHPNEWSNRIGYVQLFNSIGTTIGLGMAGVLSLRAGTIAGLVAAVAAAGLARFTLPARAAVSVSASPELSTSPTMEAHRHISGDLLGLLIGWFLLILGVSCFFFPYPIIMHHVFEVSTRSSSSVLSIATLVGLPLYAISGNMVRRLGSSIVLIFGTACRLASLSALSLFAILHTEKKGSVILLLAVGVFQGCWPIISVSVNDRLLIPSL